MLRLLTSFSLLQWHIQYSTDQSTLEAHRSALFPLNTLNHMAWDKAKQTYKVTHSDKTDLERVTLLFPGSGGEKSLGEQLFFSCVFYVCGFLFLGLTVTFKQGHKQKVLLNKLTFSTLRATRQNRVTSAELSSLNWCQIHKLSKQRSKCRVVLNLNTAS